MSKSSAYSNDLLKLIFNGVGITGLAEDDGVNPITTLFVALHTSDPGASGGQSTAEVNYQGYARVAVSRSEGGWAVTGNSVSPVDPIEFGEMTGGNTGTATHVTIGTQGTGTGKVLYRGAINPPVHYDIGVVPRIRTSSIITEE